MYTRSYNIQSRRDLRDENEKSEQKPEEKIDVPEGYSGTLMLREQEDESNVIEEQEERPPLRRHKPVKFSFTRTPKFLNSETENEKTAHGDTGRSDNMKLLEPEAEICCDSKQIIDVQREKHKHKTELDRLLIGALILLLISEGCDDVLVMILGYLFI